MKLEECVIQVLTSVSNTSVHKCQHNDDSPKSSTRVSLLIRSKRWSSRIERPAEYLLGWLKVELFDEKEPENYYLCARSQLSTFMAG